MRVQLALTLSLLRAEGFDTDWALALRLTDANTHYQLGLCLNDLSMKAEAAQCFQTALQLGVGAQHELGVRALLSYFEREACSWQHASEGLAQLQAALAR